MHKKIPYKFVSITDPKYVLPEGSSRKIGDAFLAVSIPIDNYKDMGYFKFVASVFPTEKPWTKEDDEDLIYEHNKGWALQLMCAAHKRTEEEIRDYHAFYSVSRY